MHARILRQALPRANFEARSAIVKTAAVFRAYLFRSGGAYAIAICRVVLFSYLLIHVVGDAKVYLTGGAAAYLTHVNLTAYYPKSIVYLLFPSAPPPAWFIDSMLQAAQISTFLAILGLLTRPAMIVSTLSSLFLGSLIFSWEPLWSHPYNSGLLAALAFMFGRAGDTLSMDALIARYVLRRPIPIDRDVYWWPVILGQFGVAAVYFGGFYAKWSTPDFTYDFAWVFSDNLRNSVALPWLIRGQELPWHIAFIVSHPLVWKLCAFGHLATQALPIFAIFSLRKPYIRLFEGFTFVAGIVLLKLVMGMWNPAWIILAAFFVDWEYFLSKLNVRFPSAEPAQSVKRAGPVITYALAFMTANLVIIGIRYDDWGSSRLYPFSSMNFYSNVAARKPYNVHKHYPFTYGELVLDYSNGTTRKWSCYPTIASSYLMTYASNGDPVERVAQQVGAMKAVLNTIASYHAGQISDCVGMIDDKGYTAIDLYSSILEIPAYPAPPKFEVGHRALVSRYEKDRDRIVAASGRLKWEDGKFKIDVASSGLDVDRYELLLSNDPWAHADTGPLLASRGRWSGTVFSMNADYYKELPTGWYPIVVRAVETDGRSYDFFAGILYR